jgi:acyl-CoA synthetase (AMP-forming)/AMP-acid ligase II
MRPDDCRTSLSGWLGRSALSRKEVLAGTDCTLLLSDLLDREHMEGGTGPLAGRSVLVRVQRQSAAAAALIALDGVARRIVICPPDLAPQHLPHVLRTAEVECCVADGSGAVSGLELPSFRVSASGFDPKRSVGANRETRTEWVLLTSGTTGTPKLVLHSLASLTGAIGLPAQSPDRRVWSTFYDIRRYGGLQIFLRAMLTRSTLVLSDSDEPVANFLARAGQHGVTHFSGTPSHWRRALMSPAAAEIRPRYVRLSGEIADAAILGQLRAAYPGATVAHAFASTEAGVAFEVEDGQPGIPTEDFERAGAVEMRIEDESLRIRSSRVAERYLGDDAKPLKSPDGFVDTGDMLERRGDRYYFAGRRDGMINVGGAKVHPEEVEAVINRHPGVRISMVRARRSPITGAVLVADVVLNEENRRAHTDEAAPAEVQSAILQSCRKSLAAYKVPAAIKIVASLPVAPTGKLLRQYA